MIFFDYLLAEWSRKSSNIFHIWYNRLLARFEPYLAHSALVWPMATTARETWYIEEFEGDTHDIYESHKTSNISKYASKKN